MHIRHVLAAALFLAACGGTREHRVAPPPRGGTVVFPQSGSKVLPTWAPNRHARPSRERAAIGPVRARLLVLAADGNEPDFAAIRQALDDMGTPYDTWLAVEKPGALTYGALASGGRGNYQGVILTTSNLAYENADGAWVEALSVEEWAALTQYEVDFAVREVAWYAFPTAAGGWSTASLGASGDPVSGHLTAAGQAIFTNLDYANDLPIANAWVYFAPALADGSTTVLMTAPDGSALAVTHEDRDAATQAVLRESLSLSFDSAPWLVHDLALQHGLVAWVTRGHFVGERRVTINPQLDDMFISDDLWNPDLNVTIEDETDPLYRAYLDVPADVDAFADWQKTANRDPITKHLQVAFAFNAEGVAGGRKDPLLKAVQRHNNAFDWINHTYSHMNLDAATYAEAWAELDGDEVARNKDHLNYWSQLNLVTPDISGLFNAGALQAAFDLGIRYVVMDTSHPEQGVPGPNAGVVNGVNPNIFQVPRRPTNLFYNVSTPAEWTDEYNYLYWETVGDKYFDGPQSYAQILDNESTVLSRYVMRGEGWPWMFHVSNIRAYDGAHSLFTDLLDATISKYESVFALPTATPHMEKLAARLQNRTTCDGAGLVAWISGAQMTLTAATTCTTAVTGTLAPGYVTYGGEQLAYVTVPAGQTVTITLAP